MKKLITDASPLIFLAKAGLIDALKRTFKKVYLTPYIWTEIEKPIKMGFPAPEVETIKSKNIISIEEINAKEITDAKKLSTKLNIGIGESEAAILFKRGHFTAVLVADRRAQRKMKEIGVNTMDLIDLAFEVAERGIMNPRQFALKLWYQAHFRSERVKNILGRNGHR